MKKFRNIKQQRSYTSSDEYSRNSCSFM